MRQSDSLRTIEATFVLLFFLQALRAIFSVMFGIIYDQIFAGSPDAWLPISNLLVILALMAPVFAPRAPRPTWLAACAGLAALGRIALTVNEATFRFWGSLVVIAAGGLYLACLLGKARPVVWTAFLAALVLDQLLRAAGDTYDLSMRSGWLPVQVAWGLATILLAIGLARRTPAAGQQVAGAPGYLWGLGLGSLLFLEASLLSLPNALARWSGWSYPAITPLLLALTWLPLMPSLHEAWKRPLCQRRALRLGLAGCLTLSLVIGYFTTGAIPALFLLLAQVVTLAMAACLLDSLFMRSTLQQPSLQSLSKQTSGTAQVAITRTKPDSPPARHRSPGSRLAVGMVFFLFLNFFNAFAFTYPYVLPIMRGMGWAVYLAAALLFGISVVALPVAARERRAAAGSNTWFVMAGVVALAATLFFAWPRPVAAMPEGMPIRVGTYNIHYGYDAYWHFTLEETARTIEENGADIVALQEVDTGRLTSFAVDNALYLSRRLSMNIAYLPTVEHLTGIAVLYRGQAEQVDWRLLTSRQEQTGIVHIQLRVAGQPFHAYGTWLGLEDEDTQKQIDDALSFIGDRVPATFGGDFNAEPDSPVVHSILQAGFSDPFMALGMDPPPLTDPAIQPTKRIDFVWLRGVTPTQAWVPDSQTSDHRMVVVEVKVSP